MLRPRTSRSAVVLIAALIGGCGGSSSSSHRAAATTPASVSLKQSKLGGVLAGPRGLTLYLFEADKGTTSSCTGACAKVWPPLLSTGKPQAGAGLNQSALATTHRADGGTQVTYAGHPLYTYAKDGDSGDLYGQGLVQFGASWYVLSAKGSKIDAS
ncbi:MAG: COG4315 family predicted lipoprotein [Solirubrobacteraceae bacterium]